MVVMKIKNLYKYITMLTNVNILFDFAEVSVGKHYYWEIGNYSVHGQVLIVSWIVFSIIGIISFLGNSQLKPIPEKNLQNLTEFFTEFIRDLAKTQIGEEYKTWVPFLGTLFLFIFISNWSGALIPWHLIEIPNGELAAPTNDINTTVALALLTSIGATRNLRIISK